MLFGGTRKTEVNKQKKLFENRFLNFDVFLFYNEKMCLNSVSAVTEIPIYLQVL